MKAFGLLLLLSVFIWAIPAHGETAANLNYRWFEETSNVSAFSRGDTTVLTFGARWMFFDFANSGGAQRSVSNDLADIIKAHPINQSETIVIGVGRSRFDLLGRMIVGGTGPDERNDTVALIDTPTGKIKRRTNLSSRVPLDFVTTKDGHVAVLSDKLGITRGNEHGEYRVTVLDKDLTKKKSISLGNGGAGAIGTMPNGNYAVFGWSDDGLTLWELSPSLEVLHKTKIQNADPFPKAVLRSHSGVYLVSSSMPMPSTASSVVVTKISNGSQWSKSIQIKGFSIKAFISQDGRLFLLEAARDGINKIVFDENGKSNITKYQRPLGDTCFTQQWAYEVVGAIPVDQRNILIGLASHKKTDARDYREGCFAMGMMPL